MTDECEPQFTDCVFMNNEVPLATTGGGAVLIRDESDVFFRGCVFAGNLASGASLGGGINTDTNSRITAVDSLFVGNEADSGGAVSLQLSSHPDVSRFINCQFLDNECEKLGGGIYMDGTRLTELANCLFVENLAQNGGGVYAGGLADPVIVNCTFSANEASINGGGLYVISIPSQTPTITNTVFWANKDTNGANTDQEAQVFLGQPLAPPVVTYSCIQDGSAGASPFPFGGASNGNIDLDPDFVSAVSGNYRLAACSPCIDAGDTTETPADTLDVDADSDTTEKTPDLDKFIRDLDEPTVADTGEEENDVVVDMGAYEFQLRGDVAPDGELDQIVNGQDIQAFVDCILAGSPLTGSCLNADMDTDGDADLDDIPCFVSILLDGPGCISCESGLKFFDCNENEVPDALDIAEGESEDCDGNFVPDECDIALCLSGHTDCYDQNENGIPDGCEPDCNDNDIPDDKDIDDETSDDVNSNGIPDECEPDCNDNDVPDDWDISQSTSDDCNENGLPDECEADCNENGVPDDCDVDPTDPDGDTEVSEDCNQNGAPDECDLTRPILTSLDCNENDIPDECELEGNDCNENGFLDECDIASEISEDVNENDIPDECEQQQQQSQGGGSFYFSSMSSEETMEAYVEFWEWYLEQDWSSSTGGERFAAIVAKLDELGLPLEHPWLLPAN